MVIVDNIKDIIYLIAISGWIVLGWLIAKLNNKHEQIHKLSKALTETQDNLLLAKGYTRGVVMGCPVMIPPAPQRPPRRNPPPPPKINPVKIKEGECKSFEKQCEENAYSALEKRRKDFEEQQEESAYNRMDAYVKALNSPTSVSNKELVETLVEVNNLLRELLKKYDNVCSTI